MHVCSVRGCEREADSRKLHLFAKLLIVRSQSGWTLVISSSWWWVFVENKERSYDLTSILFPNLTIFLPHFHLNRKSLFLLFLLQHVLKSVICHHYDNSDVRNNSIALMRSYVHRFVQIHHNLERDKLLGAVILVRACDLRNHPHLFIHRMCFPDAVLHLTAHIRASPCLCGWCSVSTSVFYSYLCNFNVRMSVLVSL